MSQSKLDADTTQLFEATRENQLEKITQLLKNGADYLQKNDESDTTISVAARKGTETLSIFAKYMLVERFADREYEVVEQPIPTIIRTMHYYSDWLMLNSDQEKHKMLGALLIFVEHFFAELPTFVDDIPSIKIANTSPFKELQEFIHHHALCFSKDNAQVTPDYYKKLCFIWGDFLFLNPHCHLSNDDGKRQPDDQYQQFATPLYYLQMADDTSDAIRLRHICYTGLLKQALDSFQKPNNSLTDNPLAAASLPSIKAFISYIRKHGDEHLVNAALIEAARLKQSTIVKNLLDAGVDPSCKSIIDGTTPLHWTIRNNDIVTTKLLLAKNADPFIKETNNKSSLIMLALSKKQWKLFSVLYAEICRRKADLEKAIEQESDQRQKGRLEDDCKKLKEKMEDLNGTLQTSSSADEDGCISIATILQENKQYYCAFYCLDDAAKNGSQKVVPIVVDLLTKHKDDSPQHNLKMYIALRNYRQCCSEAIVPLNKNNRPDTSALRNLVQRLAFKEVADYLVKATSAFKADKESWKKILDVVVQTNEVTFIKEDEIGAHYKLTLAVLRLLSMTSIKPDITQLLLKADEKSLTSVRNVVAVTQ